jgi:UPF0271 protein
VQAVTAIDLNADLGEGVSGDDGVSPAQLDDLLLQEISSANVACGGHAGDARSMSRVCRTAVERGVAIGAQVSYVDRAGFGRTRIDVGRATLVRQLADQVAELREHASAVGGTVSYLKPHGALYNAAADDADVAAAVLEAVLVDSQEHGQVPLPLLTLPGCALAAAAARHDVPFVTEAFVDRAYTRVGRLVPRATGGAVITDPDAVVRRALDLAIAGRITSIDGFVVDVDARSLCLHSDTPGSARTAALVRAALVGAGLTVAPFAGTP